MDVAAIRRVWPAAPASLQRSFDDARSYELEVQNLQVTVQGDTATVSAVRRTRSLPKAGRLLEVSVQTTFSLRRTGNGWLIDSIR
jgi:ketosteroid isomerase-like protein